MPLIADDSVSHDQREIARRVARALQATAKLPKKPKPSDSLVNDLGFDSLKIAGLALALENEFGEPLLLVDWVTRVADPSKLTVQSLCDYIEHAIDRDD